MTRSYINYKATVNFVVGETYGSFYRINVCRVSGMLLATTLVYEHSSLDLDFKPEFEHAVCELC